MSILDSERSNKSIDFTMMYVLFYFLDSERSNECIDFTMMCVIFLLFFVSVITF